MRILLVCDLQKQFKGKGYDKCLEFVNSHGKDYDRVVATLFANNRKVNGNFVNKLKWNECRNVTLGDIEFSADQVVIKYGYGLSPGMFNRTDKIDIVGCETDACVLATESFSQ